MTFQSNQWIVKDICTYLKSNVVVVLDFSHHGIFIVSSLYVVVFSCCFLLLITVSSLYQTHTHTHTHTCIQTLISWFYTEVFFIENIIKCFVLSLFYFHSCHLVMRFSLLFVFQHFLGFLFSDLFLIQLAEKRNIRNCCI